MEGLVKKEEDGRDRSQDVAAGSPKAPASGFRPCSNYVSPQTTVAALGPGGPHGFYIHTTTALNHVQSNLCIQLFRGGSLLR